ncbi:MAG: Nramp family divalent metal transporter [Planctomycetota bacterium]|nr:Nramp family divalent metal transporter [Planctomycetota bacterium]
MSQVLEHQVNQSTPPDPGCLPAWSVAELPAPALFRLRNCLTLIGPGLVLVGGAIGTGEFVMGPKTAAQYGGAMLFVVILSILAQVLLNTEVMRYTLVTGEPIMTGFMRSRPGPKFWIVLYLLLDIGSWWPAQAMLAAQILVVMWYKLGPTADISPYTNTIIGVSYVVFILCGVLVLFGGKIYNTISLVITGKFLITLFFMLFTGVFFVSGAVWWKVWSSLIDPTRLPIDQVTGKPYIDWGLISALTAYAGVGGMGNILASNFVREKGWGMGCKVGAIPSAIGGRNITLSHIGTIAPGTRENVSRFRRWFTRVGVDQYVFWACGSLLAMMLPCMIGLQYLHTDSLKDAKEWQWAAAVARDFKEGGALRQDTLAAKIFPASFTANTLVPAVSTGLLLIGLIIMIPGQFYTVDVTARRWTDAIWSASRRAREMETHSVKYIYYAFAAFYILLGIVILTICIPKPELTPLNMLKIAGAMANLAISACILHTLYVNHRFLPKPFRPGLGKSLSLVLAGTFFLVMFGLVANQKLVPLFLGK